MDIGEASMTVLRDTRLMPGTLGDREGFGGLPALKDSNLGLFRCSQVPKYEARLPKAQQLARQISGIVIVREQVLNKTNLSLPLSTSQHSAQLSLHSLFVHQSQDVCDETTVAEDIRETQVKASQ